MKKGISLLVLFFVLVGCEKKVFIPPEVSEEKLYKQEMDKVLKRNRPRANRSNNGLDTSSDKAVATVTNSQTERTAPKNGDLSVIQKLFQEKEYSRALEELNKYTEEHPDEIAAWELKLEIYVLINDLANVQKTLEAGLNIAPKNSYLLATSGDFFVKRRRYQLALNSYLKLLEVEERYPFLFNTALVYEKLQQLDNALIYFKKSANLKPGAKIYYIMGDIAKKRQKYTQAISYLNKAIRYDRKHLDAYRMLGAIKITQQQYQDAIQYYEKVAQSHPSQKEYQNLAAAYQYNAQYGKALKNYKKVLKYDRNNTKILYQTAYACFKIKDAKQMNQYILQYQRQGQIAKIRQLKGLHSRLLRNQK